MFLVIKYYFKLSAVKEPSFPREEVTATGCHFWGLVSVPVFTNIKRDTRRGASRQTSKGARWLSARMLDLRLRGCGFEPHLGAQ